MRMPTVNDLGVTLRNGLKPRFLRALPDKVASRASHLRHKAESPEVREWCSKRATSPAEYIASVDKDLAEEAEAFGDELRQGSRPILAEAGIPFGGGDPALLYFLVRYARPRFAVETGVAAGFSSAAILTAMDRNGDGELWSSELPYIRQARPEDLVGIVVPEALRGRWHLFLDGDGRNLRGICSAVPRIDFFVYDSDKSYRGRARAFGEVRSKIGDHTTLVFDDIEDNGHFRQLVSAGLPFHIVHTDRRYIGIIPGWERTGAWRVDQ